MEYQILKTLHLVGVVCWFAMLFYLPRLFVYHAENNDNDGFVKVVKVQEKKLYQFIGMPAMIVTIISGLCIIVLYPSILKGAGWFHAKMLFVVLLLIYHFLCGYYRKQLENNTCQKSGKFFRVFNEIPTLLFICIVSLAVIKPF